MRYGGFEIFLCWYARFEFQKVGGESGMRDWANKVSHFVVNRTKMSNCVTSLWWFFSPRGIIQNYSPRFFTHKLRGGEGNMELLFHEGLTIVGQGHIRFSSC